MNIKQCSCSTQYDNINKVVRGLSFEVGVARNVIQCLIDTINQIDANSADNYESVKLAKQFLSQREVSK